MASPSEVEAKLKATAEKLRFLKKEFVKLKGEHDAQAEELAAAKAALESASAGTDDQTALRDDLDGPCPAGTPWRVLVLFAVCYKRGRGSGSGA